MTYNLMECRNYLYICRNVEKTDKLTAGFLRLMQGQSESPVHSERDPSPGVIYK